MFDNTNEFKSIICYIILLLIVYFINKKNYTVLTFSWSFTSFSLGGGLVFGLPFARYYLSLLYIFTLYLFIKSINLNLEKSGKKVDFFGILLLTILIKILLDTLVYGIDEFRAESLIIGFHVIILSIYVFHNSFVNNGYEKTLKDFILSGLLIHGIISIVLFYPIFQNQLIPALGLGHRITIFEQDTINSAKPFFFYIVFLLAAIKMKLVQIKFLKFLASIIGVFCLIILILNGTRAFPIALFFVVVFPLLKFNYRTIGITSVLLICLPILYNSIEDNYGDLTIVQRFSADHLNNERTEGREEIWKRGFSLMFSENPILGLGFRNFGEVGDVSDPQSSNVVIRKDNAHGFYQEVFIEHGIILGLLLLLSFFYTLYKLRVYSGKDSPTFKAIFIVLISFAVTSLFSGSFLNSIGYFYLGLFLYHIPKPRMVR
jgi:hypothetical protein